MAHRPVNYTLALGMNVMDWPKLAAWRSLCQQHGDSRDQPREERRMWQRRTKAARILCDFVWPKTGSGVRERDFPEELAPEIYLAFCMGVD